MHSSAFITFLLSQINLSILPVILLPVTGLSCLLFYNRLGGLVSSIQNIERELRNQLKDTAPASKAKEEVNALYAVYKILVRRSHIIRMAIKLCFCALFVFAITAITVIATVYYPVVVFVTLGCWIIGALCYAGAIIYGFREIHQPIFHSIHFQTELIEKWMSPV